MKSPKIPSLVVLSFLILPLLWPSLLLGSPLEWISGFSAQSSEQVQQLAQDRMGLALLLCFISGLLTSFTPCVYPVIPITINIFARFHQVEDAGKKFNFKSFSLALIYVAGMCTTYTVLGLVSGLTGSLFGSIMQSNAMIGFLTLLFLILGLGQMGAFEMSLPGSLQTKLMGLGNHQSKPGIFLMGLFAGLIVSPCVGPILAGILAFVFESSNALLGGLYFLSFSLGLGVLFLLIGGFSGILAQLPRSGNWMKNINRLLGLLLFAAALYYGNIFVSRLGLFQSPASQQQSGDLTWIDNEAQAMALAQASGKPMMIDFTATWCEACHTIEREVFEKPEVIEQLKSRFITARVDVTSQSEENQKLLQKYKVQGLPAILFVQSDGQILKEPRINGVLDAAEFLELIQKVP